MQSRTISLSPVLSPRPTYAQVARYQQEKADLEALDTVVSGVGQEMRSFQKLDGGLYDRHRDPGNVAVDRPWLMGRTGIATVGVSLLGLLGMAGTCGVQAAVSLVGLAALASPVVGTAAKLLTGANPLVLPFAHEAGELESKDGDVVRFWREVSNRHATSYSRSDGVEHYTRGNKSAKVHRSESGPAFAVLEGLERPAYPAQLQLPTLSDARGATIPIEETPAGPWLSDQKESAAAEASRRKAEQLIDRVRAEARKLARLDDGPQDFRPQEPGQLIVCTPTIQGEMHTGADGKIVSYIQRDASGLRGFSMEDQRETYYDRGVQVIVNRATGTLNLAYEG